MIPDKSDERWKLIVMGKINKQFKTVSAGLCVSRTQRIYRMERTEFALNEGIDELHSFFSKYEKLAKEDIEDLFT